MRWFEKQRIEWLSLRFNTVGHANRADLVKQFQVSIPTASKDFATYKRLVKKWMMPKIVYNATTKRYEVKKP